MQPEKGRYFFTSESVTEGHPDKVADQISDAILDTLIEQDPGSRVACETLVTTGMAVIAGEISTKGYADLPKVVRETIKEIGYNSSEMGFDWQTCAVISSIDHQSGDIAQGVDREDPENQGAGDQVGEQGGRAGGGDGMAGADEQAGADHPGDRQHGDVALFQAGRERGVALVRQL